MDYNPILKKKKKLSCIVSQNCQTHFKNFTAFAARPSICRDVATKISLEGLN